MVRCRRINILFFFYTIFLLLFYSHCHFDLGSFNILMFIYVHDDDIMDITDFGYVEGGGHFFVCNCCLFVCCL